MLADIGAEGLGPGLWRWTAYHPDWKADVGCLVYEDAGELVLIDPLAPLERRSVRRFWSALDEEVQSRVTPVHVLLTVFWHERHAPEVVARYARRPGAELWAPAGAVARLTRAPDHAFAATDPLPAGIVALPTARGDEVVLWLPPARAVVAGDVLLGGKRKPLRVCPQSWLPRGVTRAALAASLTPLLDLPVETVVPAHGAPLADGARQALATALAEAAA